MSRFAPRISRRSFLKLSAAAPFAGLVAPKWAGAATLQYDLTAAESSIRLAAAPFPETKLWSFNGVSPGPAIRVKQNQPVRIAVRNTLAENTGVHWHGLRIDNAMDGIPFLTQPPIEPGETFNYDLVPPDAGTYWYHSHENSAIQVARGMSGPFIVEEEEPLQVDRELVWMLSDWRLDRDAQIVADFSNDRDYSRSGRIGNTVTLNGRQFNDLKVRAGERIRLRIINGANARIFSLRFQGHAPTVIAVDGQPVEPFVPKGNAVTLAPAQRADVILDMSGRPGDRYSVIDTFYPQAVFRLVDIEYAEGKPLRESPLHAPVRLAANPVPRASLSNALEKEVLLEGGDLGRARQQYREGRQQGLSEMLLINKFWAICGVAAFRQVMPPFVSARVGQSVVLDMKNYTAWPHTMHLHGHTFRIEDHNGQPDTVGQLRDTVWLGPEEEARVSFVADNKGDWLFHCHMLSHAEAGMLATVRVA